MGSKSPEDILGFEYDWLAIDHVGHLGLFSTAGGGRAPEAFLEDTEAHVVGLEALMAAPKTTAPLFYPSIKPGLENAWKEAAERGVFAFDSDPNGGPYRLVAAPQRPIQIAQAPGPTAEAAIRVKLDHLHFAGAEQGGELDGLVDPGLQLHPLGQLIRLQPGQGVTKNGVSRSRRTPHDSESDPHEGR